MKLRYTHFGPANLRHWFFLYLFFFVSAAFAQPRSGDTVKVLAIGNSFSEDAVENNLYDLAKEKGIKMIIGNLSIGGAPLSLHLANSRENKDAYSYRKIDRDGNFSATPKVSIEKALADEDWDYISFQQASPLSGKLETVAESLPELFDYVKKHSKNPSVKFLYQQTWAYSRHSPQPAFANYDKSQEKMYQAIVNVSKEIPKIAPIDYVIPVGTAIQNARTSFIGDNFDRDGFHLRMPLGRYLAACTWFEKIFAIPVTGMEYKPKGVTEVEKEIAQAAAHAAVESPFSVTILRQFAKAQKGKRNPAAILVDFGGTLHEGPWNPITTPIAGKTYVLNDSLGEKTRINLVMVSRFNGKTGNGAELPENTFSVPSNVTSTAYFGNTLKPVGGVTTEATEFEMTGLRKKKKYNVVLFATKMGNSPGKQETKIVCSGKNEKQGNLTEGGTGVVTFEGMRPRKDGSLVISVTAGPANTTAEGFYYLSGLRLK